MNYIDLHCDSITACYKSGRRFGDFEGQVNAKKLQSAGCLMQCFALFTEGENAGDFKKYTAFYTDVLKQYPVLTPVYTASDVLSAQKSGKVGAMLTVENAGFLKGDISGFSRLHSQGVRMLSLVWNTPNAFAYPNLVYDGTGVPDLYGRESEPLTEKGRQAVEELNRLKIIIDVSHLSDGGVEDVLALSSAPIVASHSNAHSVCPVSRNLTDGQLKKIADKGGVTGLNFCWDFLGGEDAFAAVLAHYKHAVSVMGEDGVALGSDFDGIPRYPQLDDCTAVPRLLDYMNSNGVPSRQIEKLAQKNFLRVLADVCG